jgi:hypothetical protein
MKLYQKMQPGHRLMRLVRAVVRDLLLVAGLALRTIPADAQDVGNEQLRMTQQEVINKKATVKPGGLGTSGYAAVQQIIIHGDPAKTGLYTILLKVAANTKIAAHNHPDERMATVISGDWYFGYGDVFDAKKLKKLSVGSIYSEVAKQNHFAMTKGPIIVQITGYGPSGVSYENPADDPAAKKINKSVSK